MIILLVTFIKQWADFTTKQHLALVSKEQAYPAVHNNNADIM